LYNAKNSLLENLPKLVSQATFQNLKHALAEDLADCLKQMAALREIFNLLNATWNTHQCLGMEAIVSEALEQVSFQQDNHYESDMSILFYLAFIRKHAGGRLKILSLLAEKIAYKPYAHW
jgi:ferritin-like metal-binding protein YciE